MKPMFLPEIENTSTPDAYAATIVQMKATGVEVPQILHLFRFKPDATHHLCRFTQAVMRGPSPLSPGQKELIAAFTSRRNNCPF
jgi:hypothetical protein